MDELQILIDRYLNAQDKALDAKAEREIEDAMAIRAEQAASRGEIETIEEARYWDDVAEEMMEEQSRRKGGYNA